MKGITRRARTCALVAVTGVTVLAGSGVAQAQSEGRQRSGDGVPTGQLSTQMFNYGGYLTNGGTPANATAITGVSTACLTGTVAACQRERLEGLFRMFQRRGVTGIELFGHAGFPPTTISDGQTPPTQVLNVAGLTEYRQLLDKYGLHAGGWHGDMGEAGWANRVAAAKILGADYLGSGGTPSPGIGSHQNVIATAETANRLGKIAVEAGVGKVYIHNHQQEFRTRYVDNGVLKTAWQIYMERVDARYAGAEIDAFWSSDAYDDVTGQRTADLINQFPTKVKLLHVKDGVNVVPTTPLADPLACGTAGQPSCQNASPRTNGFAVAADRVDKDGVNYIPILNAAAGRVQYYHHEHDGGTVNNASDSFLNLRGINARAVGTVLGKPTTFPSVAAGTAAAANVVPVVLENTGDAPLTITALSITADALDVGSQNDFAIVSQNCTAAGGGGPLAASTLVADDPATPVDETAYATPRGKCTVSVGFKPTRSGHRSVARLQITSGSDAATEQVLLTAASTNDALLPIGGSVASVLSLSIATPGSFGSFVPATARNYDTSAAATIVSTAGDASLSVTDASATATGKLVNGAFALSSPLQVRAANAAQANPAFQPLSDTGTPVNLLSYATPTAGADPVTLSFRQAITATEVLRAGTYSKTLTFTLSTTTP